ncbi:MAG: translational GTPase TypA [Proteobacteria bacterium]|nr:translational GTPase TypA [Pseudomonadota bacterium]
MKSNHIRNVAIIAHVDHGKTTLVDALLRQSGVFRANEAVTERVMDSNDLEKERGITILAKNTAIMYGSNLINIVDTPGHADFGSEVERVLGMVDGTVLLVDASEGPMPQTKFVLSKALKQGLRPIVVINKVDRKDARISEVENEVFELFDSLGATEEQLDFPVMYAVGRDGWVSAKADEKGENCKPLMDLIIKHVPAPVADSDAPFSLLGTTMERDPYLGRLITGRIYTGTAKVGMPLKVMTRDGKLVEKGRVTKILAFRGVSRQPVESAVAGDIVSIAGLPNASVSHTLCDESVNSPLAAPAVEPPTLSMTFSVNDSPLCGRDGDKLTSREIGNRLMQEAEINVGLHVEQGDRPETFVVNGRGELQLAVLIETMRREGFELSVSRPRVIFKEQADGQRLEPYEEVIVDVDADFAGVVMEKMGLRKAELVDMVADYGGKQRLIFEAPSRGMIGYRSEFMMDTRGTGILTRQFKHYGPVRSQASSRRNGVLVSMIAGKSAAYALWNLEERGVLFIGHAEELYDGMVIGECAKEGDLEVNPVKGKQLTNIRAAGKDDAVKLTPPRPITLEYALTYINDDELVEVTPGHIRLRKKGLDSHTRKLHRRELESQQMSA